MNRDTLAAIRHGEKKVADVATSFDRGDLERLTNDIIDQQLAMVAKSTDADVTFEPQDPEADDQAGADDEASMPWTLGHLIVHTTAGSEEAAAVALTQARGAPVEGRPRYETPWQDVRTMDEVRQRLEESRRMRLAMLAAWPDEPHLDNTVMRIERFGPANAISSYLLGMVHEEWHFDQIADVVAQASDARAA